MMQEKSKSVKQNYFMFHVRNSLLLYRTECLTKGNQTVLANVLNAPIKFLFLVIIISDILHEFVDLCERLTM